MPTFEFRFTCTSDEICKKNQLSLPEFKYKYAKGIKSYDHSGEIQLANWEVVADYADKIEKKLGEDLVDLTIIEKTSWWRSRGLE